MKPHHQHPTLHQTKSYEKKAIDIGGGPANNRLATTKAELSSPPKASTVVTAKNVAMKPNEGAFTSTRKDILSKAGPGRQTQAFDDAKSSVRREQPPAKLETMNQKSGASKVGGKESPTKPVLVQTATTATKPTIKQMSVKNTNGKPVLKESPIRPVPIQIKSTNSAKFSGKESPVRSFPGRTANQKQSNRTVRPGPVQIKSNRLVAKETPAVRPVPVHVMSTSRKTTAAKDNPSDAVTMATRMVSSSSGLKEKHSSSPVKVNPFLAKEVSLPFS